MVFHCVAYGCKNRQKKGSGIHFYRFPANKERCDRWVSAVKRDNWAPTVYSRLCSKHFISAVLKHQCEKTEHLSSRRRQLWLSRINRADLKAKSFPYVRVCSEHFVLGKPSALFREDSIDWAPSLKLTRTKKVSGEGKGAGSKSNQPLSPDFIPSVFKHTKSPQKRKAPPASKPSQRRRTTKERRAGQDGAASLPNVSGGVAAGRNPFRVPGGKETGTQTQTDLTSPSIDALIRERQQLQAANAELKSAQRKYLFDVESLKGSDKKVKQCTGMSSYAVLMEVFKITEPFLQDRSLSRSQQFMMTLLRLRFNVSYVILSYIYGLHASSLSRIFLDVIHVMNCKLVPALVFWPDKDQVRLSMPACFRLGDYSKCVSIIDCFEVFLETPSDLKARAQTYSNSKSRITVKYFVSVAPQGFISFVSKGWGGRTPDKYVTEQSGFLDFLLPGDVVLADRGLDIKDSLAVYGATLEVPPSASGEALLDPSEVEKSKEAAKVRKHAERVVGMLRRNYSILKSTIPTEYMKKYGCYTTLDRIVRVASALSNVSTPVVPAD